MAMKRKMSGSNMANRNKRIKKEEEEDQSRSTRGMVVDTYTYQLPELVISQIISHLSFKYIIKASILSKEWASLCSSVLVLDIDEDEGKKQCDDHDTKQRREFLKFLTGCLKIYENQKHLEKLRLHMRYLGAGDCKINKSVSFALERNVKELDICFKRENSVRKSKYYCLLQTLLSNAKSLTILKLENLRIEEDSIDPITFPSLKTMSLKAVKFTGNTGFSRLYSGCPCIEYLSLNLCHGWDVRLSSSRLKHLEILCCEIKLRVEATNLESFKFQGDHGLRRHIIDLQKSFYIASCQTLRSLEFSHTRFPSGWFQGLDSRFPYLERLALHTCFSYSGLIISSQNLRSFVFHECRYILSKLYAPNLSEATITIEQRRDYDRLRIFFGNFDSCKKIRLHVNEAEICIFPEEMRKKCSPPLPSLQCLEVEIDTVTTTAVAHSALMDSLRWMAPSLEFLSINRIYYIYDSRIS
ncbi:PREDICTED: F-box/FBD/LRR-repeat protein At1g78750-like [Fragaria vesca subsp. vesca]|uniref:F-box/FBD/LRR-repeat protein At1g78750-like n=1 Tax=Fragaria vesca subsp. vesca TaxID=101020 RepID=UPI0002C3740A|nr:PREDICTED: F-box/FBD/LRR-repeat protein At1g78750-like [Fragaria vesca subsp. vesca]